MHVQIVGLEIALYVETLWADLATKWLYALRKENRFISTDHRCC